MMDTTHSDPQHSDPPTDQEYVLVSGHSSHDEESAPSDLDQALMTDLSEAEGSMSDYDDVEEDQDPPEGESVTPNDPEPCWGFVSTGTCPFGARCQFSHTTSSQDAEESDPFVLASDVEAGGSHDEETARQNPEDAPIPWTRPHEVVMPPTWLLQSVVIYSQQPYPVHKKWTIDATEIAPFSTVWSSILSYPGELGGPQDPCLNIPSLERTDFRPNAFRLRNVASQDFDSFLAVLRSEPKDNFAFCTLKPAVILAHDWGFGALFTRMKRDLDLMGLSTFEKLELGARCMLEDWVREAYVSLAMRIQPLGIDETQALGNKATTAISRARERVLIQRLRAIPFKELRQWRCPTPSCRQILRDAWVEILQSGAPPDMPNLAVNAALLNQITTGVGLCAECACDDALIEAVNDQQMELTVATTALEQELGTSAADWIS